MKLCVIIPCYNHCETLPAVLAQLEKSVGDITAIVVDDGSCPPLAVSAPNAKLIRLEKNGGKAGALLAGFACAMSMGFTHAITLDADGQHPAEKIADFAAAAELSPNSIVVGVRDFENSAIPPARKFMNKFSNFWFFAETGVRVGDTQCGFRCYPLESISRLNLSFGGFVFEVELLVKAAWAGVSICEVAIPAIYDAQNLGGSHYRPIVDTARFTLMNTRLFFTRVFTTRNFRKTISIKK